MTEEFLSQISARGFACAGVLFAAAILIKVVPNAATTTTSSV